MANPNRFGFGTPKEVWSTLTRCWVVAPTSDQIVSDIANLPNILTKIIENEGCVVDDMRLRSGRRYESISPGKKGEINKPKIKDRIDTLKESPLHPHAQPVFNAITNFDDDYICRLDNLMVDVELEIDEDQLNYSDGEF
jgi:hypothetical protein